MPEEVDFGLEVQPEVIHIKETKGCIVERGGGSLTQVKETTTLVMHLQVILSIEIKEEIHSTEEILFHIV